MSLFPELDLPEQATRLVPRFKELAGEGIYLGTSLWKYDGGLGSIYAEERYKTRGKLSRKKFDETCLEEYAHVFPTACGEGGGVMARVEGRVGTATPSPAGRSTISRPGAARSGRRPTARSE